LHGLYWVFFKAVQAFVVHAVEQIFAAAGRGRSEYVGPAIGLLHRAALAGRLHYGKINQCLRHRGIVAGPDVDCGREVITLLGRIVLQAASDRAQILIFR
jgi:hypothetical protein